MNEGNNWERATLENLANNFFKEQKRERFWRVFFRLLMFIWLFLFLYYLFAESKSLWDVDESVVKKEHVALIDMTGIIMDGEDADASVVIKSLQDAFKNESAKGIILKINSPGGSPVHAGMIHDEIFRLSEKYPNKKLYVVVTDMCLSAGYYAASAAHAIYADKASLVGSIGVLINGFGFEGALEKLGVERRLMTAGESKGILDPFSPVNPSEKAFIQESLDTVHRQFIDSVKRGRQDKIKDYQEISTGLFWTGAQAQSLGLIDGLASVQSVARDIIGVDNIKNYSQSRNWFEEFAKEFGATLSSSFVQSLGLKQPVLH